MISFPILRMYFSKRIMTTSFCLLTLLFPAAAQMDASELVTAQISVSVTIASSTPASIPQDWVESFFSSIDPDYAVTATSDYDGDGLDDYEEYYAGSDPTNGSSGLQVMSTVLSGDDVTILWSSTESTDPEPRKYRIFRCGTDALSDLADPNTTISDLQNSPSITELTALGEIDSQGTSTSYTDTNAKSLFPLFYRVFLSQPEPQAPSP